MVHMVEFLYFMIEEGSLPGWQSGLPHMLGVK